MILLEKFVGIVPPAMAVAVLLAVSTPLLAQSVADTTPGNGSSVFVHPADSPIWLSGQLNLIWQAHGTFKSPYEGENSFRAASERALSTVWTIYTGARLGRKVELLFDVESAGGHGLSDALGMAGFTNLDVVRNPSLGSAPYVARAIVHWTIPLAGEEVDTAPNPLSLASHLPVNRVEIRLGKISLADVFDVNGVLGDSHLQFTNWTIDNNGAYDYAADTRGYTVGAILEYVRPKWTLRGAEALMPTVANGINLDGDLSRARAANVEFECRPLSTITTRALVYANHANMGSYDDAIADVLTGRTQVPDIVAHREQGRLKTGVGLNVEATVAPAIRVAGRTGWNEGHHESFAYTEVNNSVEGGIDLLGMTWKRQKDRVGFAVVTNGLSAAHREYLALGGLGFLLGDGALRYGRETILETYYTARLWRGVSATPGIQHVEHPGYNRDRGPVTVGMMRLHVDF